MWKKVLAKGIKKLWCTDMNVKLLGTQARPFAELFVFIHYVYFVTTLKLSISLHTSLLKFISKENPTKYWRSDLF